MKRKIIGLCSSLLIISLLLIAIIIGLIHFTFKILVGIFKLRIVLFIIKSLLVPGLVIILGIIVLSLIIAMLGNIHDK